MSKDTEVISFRADPKTKKEIEEYQEKEQLRQSEAIRTLIREGLDESPDNTISYQVLLLWIGSLFLATQLTSTSTIVPITGIGLVALSLILFRKDLIQRLKELNS